MSYLHHTMVDGAKLANQEKDLLNYTAFQNWGISVILFVVHGLLEQGNNPDSILTGKQQLS